MSGELLFERMGEHAEVIIRTILDVGANDGESTKQFLNSFGQRQNGDVLIHSFEPFPPTFDRLQERVAPVCEALHAECQQVRP